LHELVEKHVETLERAAQAAAAAEQEEVIKTREALEE